MSRVIWRELLIPELTIPAAELALSPYPQTVRKTRAYPVASGDIAIPDPKAFRSMSRASVFLSHICMKAKDALAPFLTESPFSVGIYCAAENGPIDAPSTRKILDQNDAAKFADYYRKFRNPKMYLKQLPNLVPAQMGISLGLQGPMNVYTHATAGSMHALDQAEWDLRDGTVKAALVCTAHAFDDPMVLLRSQSHDARTLTEAAGAMLLVADGECIDWATKLKPDPDNFFGISDQIINVLRN